MPAIDDCLDESPGSPIHNQHVKHKRFGTRYGASLKKKFALIEIQHVPSTNALPATRPALSA